MAESNDEQFVPEIVANAADVQFAKNFVDYVMLLNSPSYAQQRGLIPDHEYTHALDRIFRKAVQFIGYVLEISDNTFSKMLKANSICKSAYQTFVQKGAVKCLTTHFDAKQILTFCVTISRTAALFYNNGILDAPKIAIEHISGVLQRYNMAAGEWDALRRVAKQFDDLLQRNELTPLIADPGEIESLLSTKKVIGYGSMNILPSKEHNVLSDTEENNLEQKQDCICSKLETLLEKCAKYFSGKSTDIIGLSPLKEPESSLKDLSATFDLEGNINKIIDRSGSNVKLSSGTSKTDQKSDLAENELMDKCALDDSFIPGPSSCCQKSDLTNKSVYKGELDTGVNVKDNKHSGRLTSEDEVIDNFSSTDGFLMDTSNTYQTSSFTSAKGNIDRSTNEKIGANYPLVISGEINLANKYEPGDKLVSKIPDSNQTSKGRLDVSLYKETNAKTKNTPVRNEEESPKLKHSKLERFNPPASDE